MGHCKGALFDSADAAEYVALQSAEGCRFGASARDVGSGDSVVDPLSDALVALVGSLFKAVCER